MARIPKCRAPFVIRYAAFESPTVCFAIRYDSLSAFSVSDGHLANYRAAEGLGGKVPPVKSGRLSKSRARKGAISPR